MELSKGTPLEMITAVLSKLDLAVYYKDYLPEAYEFMAKGIDDGRDPKDVLAAFIARKEQLLEHFKKVKASKEEAVCLFKKLEQKPKE